MILSTIRYILFTIDTLDVNKTKVPPTSSGHRITNSDEFKTRGNRKQRACIRNVFLSWQSQQDNYSLEQECLD